MHLGIVMVASVAFVTLRYRIYMRNNSSYIRGKYKVHLQNFVYYDLHYYK